MSMNLSMVSSGNVIDLAHFAPLTLKITKKCIISPKKQKLDPLKI